MSKKYTLREIQAQFTHTLTVIYESIQHNVITINKLKEETNDFTDTAKQKDIDYALHLTNQINLLNIAVSTSYGFAKQIFPGGHELIAMCQNNYKKLIKDEAVRLPCPCLGCNTAPLKPKKGPVARRGSENNSESRKQDTSK